MIELPIWQFILVLFVTAVTAAVVAKATARHKWRTEFWNLLNSDEERK